MNPKQKYSVYHHFVSILKRARYLLLHRDNGCMPVCLKGVAPKFYPKTVFEIIKCAPLSEFYLGFEIKNFNPAPGIATNAYELERKGKLSTAPYFTTIDKLKQQIC